jgi:hypothetical protein
MKALLLIAAIALTTVGFAQPQKMETCTGLPVANPSVKASISVEDITKMFELSVSEKLKKGTHSAVFKVLVDCNGKVTEVIYQRGTFTGLDQEEYKTKILDLTWKPAVQKTKPVSSFVFLSIEIVNGKFTVVIQ